MSKIVVIKGSARKGGNSNSMADAFIEAAKGLGHEIVECNATKMNLNGCHGCMTCFKTGKACTHDDDFNTIADDLIEADGWVFSFPVYWYTSASWITSSRSLLAARAARARRSRSSRAARKTT